MTRKSDEPGARKGFLGTLNSDVAPRVFWPAAGFIVAFVGVAMIWPEDMYRAMMEIQGWIVRWFGPYYTVVVTGFVAFSLWVGLGRYGDIKLGKDDDEPEFSLVSWFTMLFAAGMGIGLVFWGVAEPLNHLAGIPNRASGVEIMDEQGAQAALVQTFLHWGLHPWATYVVVGLAIAYAVHRKGHPVSIRWTLKPLLGNRINGWAGDLVDIVAVVGTLFGVATSLGLGVIQIGAGLSVLDVVGENPGNLLYVVLIGAITLLAVASVFTGLKKGIKLLSNVNIGLAGAVLLFVLFAGPTLFLFRHFIQSIGQYLQELLRHSFDTTAMHGDAGTTWQSWWTAFYWAWWISWASFVGVFIARISKGRTIRQFVAAVLIVPTMLTLLWFTVLGGTATNHELSDEGSLVARGPNGGALLDANGVNISVDNDSSLFQLLETLPGGTILAGFAIIAIVLFFVTSSDSGSLVVDMLASGGDPNPPVWSRIFWGTAEGVVAVALLTAGGESSLTALRYTAIVIAFPFSIVMLLMCWASLREFKAERQLMHAIRLKHQHEELTERLREQGQLKSDDRDISDPTTSRE
ncbi:BCCT family transporter [Actinophytocola gossypii]|uniref:BCCT family transporter n=1 Tax=Actinophytocola gossypii TaxID=2812003 RepID=A0ABT2JC71_9PSEU|nr:BCCT family transporter [Actinophytocola gossypii]MCT2585463.1 BCCT family transporter [Actinophytocola gossypii]